MLKRYAESFYQAGTILATVSLYFDEDALSDRVKFRELGAEATDNFARVSAGAYIGILRERLEAIDLRFSLKALNEMEAQYQALSSDEIRRSVKALDRLIRYELEERVLFFVAPQRATHYDAYESGWEDAITKFSIAADVEEAEKCFAFERWTACVFHLMRIVEVGVTALAAHLGVPAATLEKAWGDMVREAGERVKAMPHSTTADKNEQSKFSAIVENLFHVNIAWRIPSMHPARTPGAKYTESEAEAALARTKTLMQLLAAAI